MRVPKGVPFILMLLQAGATLAVAQRTAPVENVRVAASGPTHLQIDWDGQAQAYRIVYSEAVEAQQHTTCVVAQGPFTLVDLIPETEYILQVQALKPGPGGAEGEALRVLGKSQTLQAATEPWQPREWENLLLWPSRHVPTFPSGTTCPAVAAYKDELLVIECRKWAIHVSRVNPVTAEVLSSKLMVPGKVLRQDLDAVVTQDTLWVTWLDSKVSARSDVVPLSTQMLASYDLQTGTVSEAVALELAEGCGLVNFNGQLWVLWRALEPRQGDMCYIARYDPAVGLEKPERWVGTAVTKPVDAAAADLGIEILWILLGQRVGPARAEPRTLWAMKFNGQESYQQRMLRGPGRYSSPTGAALDDNIVLAYAKATNDQFSDIDITLTNAEGGAVTSTSYIRDGTYNTTPDAVALGDAIYLVYNKWSANPQHTGLHKPVNYGTYLAKIELKF